jgi:hypothetical protein
MTFRFECGTQTDFKDFKNIACNSKFKPDAVSYERWALFYVADSQEAANKLKKEVQWLADIHEISGQLVMED